MLRSGAWGDPTNGFMRAWVMTAFPSLTEVETTRMILEFAAASSAEDVIASRLILDRFDARADMVALDLPTLVIHTRNCTLHPLEEGRLLAAGIEGAEFIVVESANVACIPSDPTFHEQTRAITDFFARG
jgi:pimeloyl-ACP methyl ester carboxylesterase